MRNDADDDLEHIPSLSAARDHDEPYPAPDLEPVPPVRPASSPARASGRSRQKTAGGTGALWALVLALLVALGGLGWWSHQQVGLLERQLVATQESFAQISEEAAGRLKDISGQVVATESSVTSESEAVKLRIKQLEGQVAELVRQQRAAATEQQSLAGRQANLDKQVAGLDKRIETVAGSQSTQQAAIARNGDALQALQKSQASLEATVKEHGKLAARLDGLGEEIASLKRQGNQSEAVRRLEQDLLVLRSELENRQPQGVGIADFDAFRAQMTRNIGTLQSQIANLQGQIDAQR
ncbi:ATPase [Stutzerimonas urumqiensis]|uniref:ATPase n=1 Tax=Stutzerimonas urumqiensis TaxID=638269 RepID=UPI000EB1BCD8|nr:ATPase [Stutzerimonas urumqiensis]